jgi:hypothetical protein
VTVVGPDERFVVHGADLVTLDDPYPTGCDQDKFLATQHLWNRDGRTGILWGDCYYTADAVRTICQPIEGLHYYRRPWASEITGHPWDESFAVTFWPDDHQRVRDLAYIIAERWKRGELLKTHIRTHYAAHLGVNLDDVTVLIGTPNQTVIDDWTDDFDYPDDYDRWCERRSACSASGGGAGA